MKKFKIKAMKEPRTLALNLRRKLLLNLLTSPYLFDVPLGLVFHPSFMVFISLLKGIHLLVIVHK